MADTPESLVHRGREGTGAAQVFGREGNPMRAYYQRKQEVQQKEAIAAEQRKLEKEKRDKKMWDMINVNPEKAYQPFNKQVLEATDKHRGQIQKYFENGGNPDEPGFQRMVKKGWDDVNDMANHSNYLKTTIDETQKIIKENPYLKSEYYYPKIWDIIMDEKGNGKPLNDIDTVAIQSIYENDPMGFDANKYTKDFTSNLKENVFNVIKQKNVNNGLLTEDIETKTRGSLYTVDPTTGDVQRDANGQPIINLTPDFVTSFTDNENAKRYFEAQAKESGRDVNSVIEQFVRPQTGVDRNVKPSFSREPNWMYDYFNASKSGLKPNQIPAATNRFNKLTAIINGVGPNGEITPEAQSAVGALINSKYGDGHILDVKLVPGTNTPGTIEPFPGQVVNNSPSPRLVMRVKYSDRGLPKMESVNIAEEGAFETLNGLYENSPSEGKQTFSTDQLINLKGVTPDKIYKGQKGRAEENEQAKVVENDTVKQWSEGNSMETLVGRYHDGKKIESARKVVSDNGILGFGKKYEIELEFTKPNGDKEYKNIPVEDYEGLAKVYRGEGTEKANDNVVVTNSKGQQFQMSREAYQRALKDGKNVKLVE